MIAPDLLDLTTPLDDLSLFPGNPRKGDVEAIARSLETFGQRKPIVATTEGVVVAGNHTLLAARSLGWTEMAVVRVDDDPTMATAYALADNRTAELGHYDPVALAKMLEAVSAENAELLAAISYDATDLDDFVAALQEASQPETIEHYQPVSTYAVAGEGSFTHPSMEERLEKYTSKGIRSVVLDYPVDAYERVAAMAAELREAWNVPDTATLFITLLERACGS